MQDRFILKPAIDLYHSILNGDYFQRYNLSDFQSYLFDVISKFEASRKRKPFTFELLDTILKSNYPEIKKILYSKDQVWFEKTGQYLFFNLYEWIKNKNYFNNSVKKPRDFLRMWWEIFINYEQSIIEPNISIIKPKKILLELTSNCNLNCIMCRVGKNVYDPQRNMSFELLNNISNEILNDVSVIRLNGQGESTILPNFKDYVKLITSSNAQLEIVTNLTLGNIDIWNLLLQNDTNFLISCDASTSNLFEYIRKGANFATFKENLKYIGSNVSNQAQAQIIFTLMEKNINEILGVIDLAAGCNLGGVIVNVVKDDTSFNSWNKFDHKHLIMIFESAYFLAKTRGISLKLPDHVGQHSINDTISTRSCKNNCIHPWQEVYIRYNGDFTVCNMLNPYIFGNFNLSTFNELWTGLNASIFRNLINTEFRHPYCRNCYYLI